MTDEPIVVLSAQGPLQAEVALSKLRAEGVLAYLRYEAVGRTLGLTVDGLGRVDVLVAPADADLAREILRAPSEEGAGAGAEGQEEEFP